MVLICVYIKQICILDLQRGADWGLAGEEACLRGCFSYFQGGNIQGDNCWNWLCTFLWEKKYLHFLCIFDFFVCVCVY